MALRKDIVTAVKEQLDDDLKAWGFHLIDMQLNDITFDEVIMESMARVVASSNLRAAAENEAQALLIKKTKAAEADGLSIKIAAAAEKEASQLKGVGISLFREEVAKGLAKAAQEVKNSGLNDSFILFTIWTDSLKHIAEHGKGNVIFLDGSNEGMEKTLKQMMGMEQMSLMDNQTFTAKKSNSEN